jgi:hypothetical protein
MDVLSSFIHPAWVGEMRAAFLEEAKTNGVGAVLFDIPFIVLKRARRRPCSCVITAPADVPAFARPSPLANMTVALFESLLAR